MAKLVSSGKDLGYTILPYMLDKPLQLELFANPSDYVLGYITFNEYTGERKFTYTESRSPIKAKKHWSLDIMKEFPYCEHNGPWIVYRDNFKIKKLESFFILKFYHSNSRRTLILRKPLLP